MSLVAGQTGGTVDYFPQRGGSTYDPVLNGGSLTSMTVFAADGVTVQQVSTTVAKIVDGQYRFTFASAFAAAGSFPIKTIYSATASGPVVTDTNDTVVIYAFGGSLSNSLCTLAEAKLQLDKTSTTDDAELQSYIDAVTKPIEDYYGAILPVSVTESHDPSGPTINLRRTPYVTITTLTEYRGLSPFAYTQATTPQTASTYSYYIDPERRGKITRLSASGYAIPFTGQIIVVYVAGLSAIPVNVNLAARFLVQSLWKSQRGAGPMPIQSPEDPDISAMIAETMRSPRIRMLLSDPARPVGFA